MNNGTVAAAVARNRANSDSSESDSDSSIEMLDLDKVPSISNTPLSPPPLTTPLAVAVAKPGVPNTPSFQARPSIPGYAPKAQKAEPESAKVNISRKHKHHGPKHHNVLEAIKEATDGEKF